MKDYSDYPHPKASAPNFWECDYKVFLVEEDDDYVITHTKNSGGRIRVKGDPKEGSDKMFFISHPGGGTDSIGGQHFSSHSHVDWQTPFKKRPHES